MLRITDYMKRLGLDRAPDPTLDGLRLLHWQHQLAIPFENLDVVQGVPLSLDLDDLQEKILDRKRGGFCYELNTMFAQLVRALGYQVTLLSAQVVDRGGAAGPPFDHMTLRVDVNGEGSWLCDVGFGRAFTQPLPLRPNASVEDPAGLFFLKTDSKRANDENQPWCLRRKAMPDEPQAPDGWTDLYWFNLTPRALTDFNEMFLYHQSDPASPFPSTWICTQALPDGRITVRDLEITETHGQDKEIRTLVGEDEREQWIKEQFDIDLRRP